MSRLLCILLLGVIYVSTYTSEAKSMNKNLLRLVRLFEDIEFEDREDKKDDRSKEIDEIIIQAGQGQGDVLSEGDMMLTPVQVEEDKQAKRNLKMGKEDLGSSINDRIINAGRGRGLLKRGHSALQNPKGELDLSEKPMADGRVLSEGDMMLTPVQVEEDKQAKRNLKMGLEKRKGIKNTDRRWADNTLPYVITPNTFNNEEMAEINQAFSDFNEYTCLTVKPRTTEANYITIMDGATINQDGCWSYVGMLNEGSQKVSLSNGCRDKETVIHELGHALGFQHEQCRYDRDDFVTIDLTTVPENNQHNFDKYTRSTMNIHEVAYDYGSVMHYDEESFGKGVTMTAKDPNYQKRMGHSKGLSFADVKTLNRMYSCGGHCTGSCPDDGYFDENCDCQCHSGADVFKSGTVPINICGVCSPNPCLNGGSCSNADGTCTCLEGVSGEFCDTVAPAQFRLVGGDSEYEGRVEVRHAGVWGTVCDDSFDINDAALVCRSLGFSGALTVFSNASPFGEGSGAILLDEVNCGVDAATIEDCYSNNVVPWGDEDCTHSEDVGVRCSSPCDPNPCQNGGSCSDGTCTCTEGVSGEFCNTLDPAQHDCKSSTLGLDYEGTLSVTKDSVTCLSWTSYYPSLPSNYCRNPDNDPNGPWCFTAATGGSYGYCDIPLCNGAKRGLEFLLKRVAKQLLENLS